MIWRVIAANIKYARRNLMDPRQHLRCQFLIGQTRLRDASSARVTCQNLSAPSSIKRTRLNGNYLHPSISYELLIEDEEPNPTATPNLLINTHVLRQCKPFRGVLSKIKLLSSSSRSISTSKECLKVRFRGENREKFLLECRRLSSKSRNEKPLIRQSIGSFWALSQVRIHVFLLIFLPINLYFNFES